MFSELSNARSVTARALSVLDAFDASHRRQTLASIAKRANLPQSTTHRFLNQLVEAQALIRCSDGLYEIGSKLWRLGLLASLHADLREIALPYMEDIFQLGVDVVQIAVLDGMRCMVVERIAGSRSIGVLSKPGVRLPLHATSVGKVLLANAGAELEKAALNSLERITEQTITDSEILSKQLKEIRALDFATTQEELAIGAISVAVPIRGYGGKVIAALGVIIPASQRNANHLVPVLRVTSEALSKKLVAFGLSDSAVLKPS